MKNYEICNYVNVLCSMINKNLDEIVNNYCDDLPLFIMFNAHACYVRYDTQEEIITDITLEVLNRSGLVIEIDPVRGVITGAVAGKPSSVVEMRKETANMLLRCISVCWKKRLKEEGIISTGSDGRFVAANLLG